MKAIRLKKIELSNFKGVQHATYEFKDINYIVGANGTGKSTIYEAYLWCLFDKNQYGNQTKVQPLDENNEVKHKLTTSVVLTFLIDRIPFIVERKLEENWTKPRGTAELVLKGTTSSYAINDVPMQKSQYESKLAEIMPLDKWFLISSIAVVPAMDQKACRAALQGIAPAIDMLALATPYPYVHKGLADGFSIEELAAVVKKGKAEAKEDLDSIPAAFEAQDRLRVVEDFDELDNQMVAIDGEVNSLKAEIEEIKKAVQTADESDIRKAEEQRAKLSKLTAQIAKISSNITNKCECKRMDVQKKIRAEVEKEQAAISRLNITNSMFDNYVADINQYKERIACLRDKWKAKNSEVYQESEISDTCPTCGQPLPADKVEQARALALAAWNENKSRELVHIQKQAESAKARIDELSAEVENRWEISANLNAELEVARKTKNELQNELANLPTAESMIAGNDELLTLYHQKESLEAEIRANAEPLRARQEDVEAQIKPKKERLNLLLNQRDELLQRLAGRKTNARIEEEHKRLETLQKDLAELIAKYEGEEAQIASYRKDKITAIESGVSNLFSIVHWKMYEPNVTNDGEKEICQAIINGVPYEQQNRATQVNAGIDICNAFAKAYGVSAPLFIDNVESVTEPMPTIGQSIMLKVQEGSDLKFC